MAQDKPTLTPEWASDPPVAPPTTITEPTPLQKEEGWQPVGSSTFPDGKPVRQIMNWLLNLIWQWIVWLDAKTFRTSTVFSDQPLPSQGTAPTTGAGFTSAAAAFSGAAFADGYHVPVTDSPAYTYTASKDTYWDLGRGGTWTATAVANGAGAPAVAADSTRIYKVVTDGSGRTSVTDYRLATVEISAPLKINGTTGASPILQLAANSDSVSPVRVTRNTSIDYSLISVDDTSTVKLREYHGGTFPGGVALGFVRTQNAYWDEASNLWNRDDNTLHSYLEVLCQNGKYFFVHKNTGLGGSNTWSDTDTAGNWDRISKYDVSGGRDEVTEIGTLTVTDSAEINGLTIHGHIDANDGDYDMFLGGTLTCDKVQVIEHVVSVTNPAHGSVQKNSLYAANMPKAFVQVNIASGAATFTNSFNVNTGSSFVDSDQLTIAFGSSSMDDGNYLIMFSQDSYATATIPITWRTTSKTSTGFTIKFNGSGLPWDPLSEDWKISVVIFAIQI